MKGTVFIALNDMIEERYGLATWESLLAEVQPKSQGIYTSTEDYEDEEIIAFVLAISNRLEIKSSSVTKLFGAYLFEQLNKKHPIFSGLAPDLFSFLKSIENVIHKEVRKLYENPNLPTLDCYQPNDHVLNMSYRSARKLCFLAEGLIYGAAEHYNENISIDHNQCMHKGADQCLLEVTKSG